MPTAPAATEPLATTTQPDPAPTIVAPATLSEQAETATSQAVETVPTTSTARATTQPDETGSVTDEEEETSVEDPEEGSNGGTSEPEEEEEVFPEPVALNSSWIAHQEATLKLVEECGYYDTTNSAYKECEDPEDTQKLIQMQSDFCGCEFDKRAGQCRGYSCSAFTDLIHSLMCSDGWIPSIDPEKYGNEALCFHPDHPIHERWK